MSNTNTNRAFPSASVAGRLAADAISRIIPAKEAGKEGTPALEFTVMVNPTRSGLEAVGIRCSIVGAKRVEAAKAKLAKAAYVELSGDLKVRAYTHEDAARAEVGLEVAYGKYVTFGAKGEAPTKVSLFAAEAAEEAAAE